jgi:hypothetical protein
MHTLFWWSKMKERYRSEDLDVDGRIMLRWILRIWGGEGMNWSRLARDRGKRRDFVNTG